ncbi:hypothetical protein [Musicola paradisiaca]|uniref:Uncharacterized protein n=1 Tax=Musicola paradisiaca (strain Ech703) TaxID=579405 RepID=C6C3F8_MUSP7|nr:hypothetical protein [Musicola paradisiaca]ACS87256.1 hypothetical protein Dd703_3497 [Musicola paradisiaca Ech703]
MYNDINKIIKIIHTHFESIFSETFQVDRQFHYVDFTSENYNFRIHAVFIQSRSTADLDVSIEERINKALEEVTIEKGAIYDLTTKFVDESLLTKYCIMLAK